ncbi:MAG: hypothetical protein K6G50_06180 [bacterium]|nr:hypothetical protein [bacterium]
MYMKDFTGNDSANNNSVNQNLDQIEHEVTLSEALNAINDAYKDDANAQFIYGKFWTDEYERSGDKTFIPIGLRWLEKSMKQGNQKAENLYQIYKRLL